MDSLVSRLDQHYLSLTRYYELESNKRHFHMHEVKNLLGRAQFRLEIKMVTTPAILPGTWHRYRYTESDILKTQQKTDANLYYQHLVFYLFQLGHSIEKLLDVSHGNRSMFAFKCAPTKSLHNTFMPYYREAMLKLDKEWPYTKSVLLSHPLHNPPIPIIHTSAHEWSRVQSMIQPKLPSFWNKIKYDIIPYQHYFTNSKQTISYIPLLQDNQYILLKRIIPLQVYEQYSIKAKECIVNLATIISIGGDFVKLEESTESLYVLSHETCVLHTLPLSPDEAILITEPKK